MVKICIIIDQGLESTTIAIWFSHHLKHNSQAINMDLGEVEDQFDSLCKEYFNNIVSKFRRYFQRTGLFSGVYFGHAMPKKFRQIILSLLGVFFLYSLAPA
uniref:Uncharacterized protein n=1 Tax=Rhizophora mucronata TaxID=61149 RepID=A0A2P2LX28_RHIMU